MKIAILIVIIILVTPFINYAADFERSVEFGEKLIQYPLDWLNSISFVFKSFEQLIDGIKMFFDDPVETMMGLAYALGAIFLEAINSLGDILADTYDNISTMIKNGFSNMGYLFDNAGSILNNITDMLGDLID